MSAIYPPTLTTSLLVNTRTLPKIVYLPAASTIGAGRLLFIKDICGNAANSSIYISTTGQDTLDGRNYSSILYGLMSTNYQSVLLGSDGLLNWMILQNYNTNAIFRFQNIAQTFSYTGSNQTFVAPSNYIIVYMWGAGGGRSASTGFADNDGGAGAYITGGLVTTPGETLTIIVGQGGATNQLTTGYGGGGPLLAASGGRGCAAGGGRSAIQRSSNDIVVAGAGSGGGWVAGAPATWFGTSTNGSSVNGLNGGGGGTQLAGGALGITSGYTAGTAGSKGLGGTASDYASGGGGGWYGGGGGGVSGGNGGTGGAGSSYIDLLNGASGASGTGSTAPGTSSPYYASNAGRGGITGNTTGGNGLVVIVY